MHHTLRDWAIALIKSPDDVTIRLAMSDWMGEQGWHNFDVGDEIYYIGLWTFHNLIRGSYDLIMPTSKSAYFISAGSNKFCFKEINFPLLRSDSVDFSPKFLCSIDKSILEEFIEIIINHYKDKR